MSLTYYKRFRMEVDLGSRVFRGHELPEGYRFIPWDKHLVTAHAETKYQSFRSEIDANVFPCLGDQDGCLRLMGEISRKEGFLPEATWLLVYDWRPGREPDYCGTIQGIRDRQGYGAVQNLGVVPEHRSRGLGGCLLAQALQGFQQAGLKRAYLEVTAQNSGAVRLYQRMGFFKARTVYKAVEVAYT